LAPAAAPDRRAAHAGPRRRRGTGVTHAFERFWRSPDASHEGSGIGLAIVAHLSASSRGIPTLQRRAGGGLDASITLRRADRSGALPPPLPATRR
jgi:hypothetical protein